MRFFCLVALALAFLPTSLLLSAEAGDLTYADAYAQAQKGRPMLVIVSTEWCPACQVMKRRIMPQVKVLPLFGRVVYDRRFCNGLRLN